MLFDLYSELGAVETIAPAAYTAAPHSDNTTGWVDLQGFQGAMIVIHAGTVTDGTFTTVVQDADVEAADKTDAAAVADAQLQGTELAFTSSVDDQVLELGYLGFKRFLRVNFTVAGGPSTGGVFAASILRGRPQNTPVR